MVSITVQLNFDYALFSIFCPLWQALIENGARSQITFYECVTGCYPFEEPSPPLGKLPRNPNEVQKLEQLSNNLVQMLLKAIAPKSSDRFTTATEFLEAIAALSNLRKVEEIEEVEPARLLSDPISDTLEIADLPQVISTTLPVAQPAEVAHPEQPNALKSQLADSVAETSDYASVVYKVNPIAAESNAQTALFDRLPPPPPPSDQDRPRGKSVILDPTGLYSPPCRCIEIRTEVEWIKSFFQSEGLYWVTGRGLKANRLCDWTREWLRVWNQLDTILEEKQNPRTRLQSLFGSVPIPAEWTDPQILQLYFNRM